MTLRSDWSETAIDETKSCAAWLPIWLPKGNFGRDFQE